MTPRKQRPISHKELYVRIKMFGPDWLISRYEGMSNSARKKHRRRYLHYLNHHIKMQTERNFQRDQPK